MKFLKNLFKNRTSQINELIDKSFTYDSEHKNLILAFEEEEEEIPEYPLLFLSKIEKRLIKHQQVKALGGIC